MSSWFHNLSFNFSRSSLALFESRMQIYDYTLVVKWSLDWLLNYIGFSRITVQDMDSAKNPGTVDQDLQDDIEKNDCMDGFEKEQEDMTLYNILSSYLGKVTGALQDFSNVMVEKENELQKVQEDSNKLMEQYSLQQEQLETLNDQALSYQRSFHDSFEKVLKKRKCSSRGEEPAC